MNMLQLEDMSAQNEDLIMKLKDSMERELELRCLALNCSPAVLLGFVHVIIPIVFI